MDVKVLVILHIYTHVNIFNIFNVYHCQLDSMNRSKKLHTYIESYHITAYYQPTNINNNLV